MTQRMATAGIFVACVCAGSVFVPAAAQDPGVAPRALQDYRSTTQHVLIACADSLAPRQGWARVSGGVGEYRNCVVKARSEVSGKLVAALRTLDAGEAVEALCQYNVAFENALLGIEPRTGERRMAYEQRQDFLLHAMAHAWGRFEVAEAVAH